MQGNNRIPFQGASHGGVPYNFRGNIIPPSHFVQGNVRSMPYQSIQGPSNPPMAMSQSTDLNYFLGPQKLDKRKINASQKRLSPLNVRDNTTPPYKKSWETYSPKSYRTKRYSPSSSSSSDEDQGSKYIDNTYRGRSGSPVEYSRSRGQRSRGQTDHHEQSHGWKEDSNRENYQHTAYKAYSFNEYRGSHSSGDPYGRYLEKSDHYTERQGHLSTYKHMSKSSDYPKQSGSGIAEAVLKHSKRSVSPYSESRSKTYKKSRATQSVSSDSSLGHSSSKHRSRTHSQTVLFEDGEPVRDKESKACLFEDGKPIAVGSRPTGDIHIKVETKGHSGRSRRVVKSQSSYSSRHSVKNTYAESISDDSIPEEEDLGLRKYQDFRIHAANMTPVSDVESLSSDSQDEMSNRRPSYRQSASRTNFTVDYENMFFPLPCLSHNKGGCHEFDCKFLHICRHFIFNRCRYDNNCAKGHNFFVRQPYSVLSFFNKKYVPIPMTHALHDLLRERTAMQIASGKTRRQEKRQQVTETRQLVVEEEEEVDPSFDARNYAIDAVCVTKAVSVKKPNEYLDKCDSVSDDESDNSSSEKEKHENEQVQNIETEEIKTECKEEINDKSESMEHDQADEHDVTVDMHEEELESVSSDGSFKAEDVSVNISNDNELKPPDKEIVKIGMNMPLVFNKPLKKQTQPTIEMKDTPVTVAEVPLVLPPLHLPPPTANNLPLFAKPSPTLPLLEDNVEGLPTYQYIPPPPVVASAIVSKAEDVNKAEDDVEEDNLKVLDTEIKKSLDDKDPELKEPIRDLWKFPHSSMLNMTVIHFVTETETFKEEFIAEMVRILLTIHLPYVTMKKLMSVIKEKMLFSIQSTADLRKILDLYPDNFKVLESTDSDDEDEDLKIVKIKARVKLNFCEKHGLLPFAVTECNCNALHMCKFYFFSTCSDKDCKFGHKLKTDHNVKVLRNLRLHRLTGEELISYLCDEDNRTLETIPSICRFYNREKSCYKGDKTGNDEICHSLHLCLDFMKGNCTKVNCVRSHSIYDTQPLALLQKLGLDPEILGDSTVGQMINAKVMDFEKTKALKMMALKHKQIETNLNPKKGAKGSEKNVPHENIDQTATSEQAKALDRKEYYNPRVPAICKFYNNFHGCKKKDWGDARFCFFLHICEDFVNGTCKLDEKCKRSHDFFTGQAAMLLKMYDIDMDRISKEQILRMLNTTAGAPVQIPITTPGKGGKGDNSNVPEEKSGEERVILPGHDKCNTTTAKSSEFGMSAKGQIYEATDVESVIRSIMSTNK